MRRRAVLSTGAVAAFAVAVAVLSGCGAGQITQTSRQVSAVPGASGNTGPGGTVALRNALVPYDGPQGYPAGGNAPITVRIFNNGPATVKLVDVTAKDDAADVTLVGAAVVTPAPRPSPTGTTTSPAPSGSGSPTPGATSPKPSVTATSSSTGQSTFSISIPPSGYALLDPGQGMYLQLTGLRRALPPGTIVRVTFTFDDGSTATLDLPVGAATVPVPRGTPAASVGAPE